MLKSRSSETCQLVISSDCETKLNLLVPQNGSLLCLWLSSYVQVRAPLRSVHGRLEVRNAVMATTTVEFLSDSSKRALKIAGILPRHGRVQEEEEEVQQFAKTAIYIVYAHRANSGLCWSSTGVGRALQELREVSIPNSVRKLCDGCFSGCESLRRVNFGSSSSLERIGFRAFPRSVSYLHDPKSI